MDLQRIPIGEFKSSPLVWTTQFNDLRSPLSLGANVEQRYLRIQLELKLLALLLPRALIRDANLVNHPELLQMLRDDVACIRTAFERGAILLAIRDTASNLVEVNEGAGPNRAFPQRYGAAQLQLPEIDSWLRDRQVGLVGTPAGAETDSFALNLEKILSEQKISEQNSAALRTAIQASRQLNGEASLLRFGDVYRHLVGKRPKRASSELVQWCRAAHVLVAPVAHSLPASTADQDLPPRMSAFLCGHAEAFMPDTFKWIDLYPRRVLTDETLFQMNFKAIAGFRKTPYGIAYFKAAKAMQQAFAAEDFEKKYADYLGCLSEYLEFIGAEMRVELVGWQDALLRRQVKIEESDAKIFGWGTPIVMMGVAAPFAIWTSSPLDFMKGAALVAGVVGAGIAGIRSLRESRNPSRLAKLLSGTTVTSPASR